MNETYEKSETVNSLSDDEYTKNDTNKIIKSKKKPILSSIGFDFNKDKYLFYSIIIYSCALAIGASFYKAVTSDTLDDILEPKNISFINLFLSSACLYMVLFLIIIFLGFSLAGHIVMNIIPVFIGFEYGLKIAYYLVNYSGKGTVYSVLMIIPSAAIFVTIIIHTLRISADMSKNLVKITKQEGSVTFEIKPYLKKYTFFGIAVLIASPISAGAQTALYNVVNL